MGDNLPFVNLGCNDGNLCNGVETFNSSSCKPVRDPGTPLVIDDGNACTTDSCNPANGNVSHNAAPAGTPCSNQTFADGAETCTYRLCNNAGTARRRGRQQPVHCRRLRSRCGRDHYTLLAVGTSCSTAMSAPLLTNAMPLRPASARRRAILPDGNLCTDDTGHDPESGAFFSYPIAPEGSTCGTNRYCDGFGVCDSQPRRRCLILSPQRAEVAVARLTRNNG